MTNSFETLYRAFEDKFRGSQDIIRERLRIYLPLVGQLPAGDGRPRRAIDLGCGRGEWLDVVAEAGFEPVGVDLNIGMAEGTIQKGFTIEIGDALEFMRRQDAASASIVSAFHLAEHLPIDQLLELLHECHRVLEDGGCLIVETPNPENVSVGTCTFYIDPTHQKPLPPVLLEFLVQQSGFARTAILRINGAVADEAAGEMERAFLTIFESARDYACLAQKQGGDQEFADILSPFVAATTQQNPANITPLNDAVRKTETDILALHARSTDEITSLHEKSAEQMAVAMNELRDAHLREIASLEEIIATHRSDAEHLRRHIETTTDAHRQQLATSRGDLTAHEATIGRLQADIAEAAAAHAHRIAGLQTELAERDSTLAGLRTETKGLHERIASIEAAHADEIAARQADAESHAAAIAAHRDEVRRLQRALDTSGSKYATQSAALRNDLAGREATIAAQLAEIERLHANAADIRFTDRIADLQADLALREAQIAEHIAAAERLRGQMEDMQVIRAREIATAQGELAARDATIATQAAEISAHLARVSERDERLAQLAQEHELAFRRAEEAGREVAALHASTSWRLTAPVRGLARAGAAMLRWPRDLLLRLLRHAVRWLRRHPAAAALARRCLRVLPPLERRALAFAGANQREQRPAGMQWALDPDPQTLDEWRKLLKTARLK